jgi:hypothetical protein
MEDNKFMLSKIIIYVKNHTRASWLIIASILFFPKPVLAAIVPLAGAAIAAGSLAAVYFFFPEIVALIGSTILNLAGFLLTLSGLIFNWLVEYTIVGFGQTLVSLQMIDAITQVWGAFRDIGNIVIIGMFVFVAISTILGIEEYGTKKMISRLLIVAILINFSLFFTKAIIDASHITANQFYNSIAAAAQSGNTTGNVKSDTDAKESLKESGGISGAFMQRLGITGLWDNYEILKESANANGGWFVLAYSLAGATLILIVAAILLYGSFLLASRAVLLVILMITSSLAFASYLIPKFSGTKYGWKGWWDTLLKSALMAPMLMIFLWASLFILQKAPGASAVSIGGFLGDPGNEANWQVVIIFIFTAGFLFASIKMSQALSSGITGFRMSGKPFGYAALAALGVGGLGWRGLGAGSAALQNSKYGAALRKSLDKMQKVVEAKQKLGMRATNIDRLRSSMASGTLEALEFTKREDADFRKGALGKGIRGLTGIKEGVVAGGGKNTIKTTNQAVDDRQKKEDKDLIERSAAFAPGKAERREIHEESGVAQQHLSTAKKQLEASQKGKEDISRAIKDLEEKISSGEWTTSGRLTEELLNEKKGALAAEDSRIKKAATAVDSFTSKVKELEEKPGKLATSRRESFVKRELGEGSLESKETLSRIGSTLKNKAARSQLRDIIKEIDTESKDGRKQDSKPDPDKGDSPKET